MSCYPFFLLTTSIITVLPLDVNADSINHFESVWNDMRDALSKGRLKKSLLTLFRFHRYPRHYGWQSTSGGPERSETRTYIAVFCVRMSMKGPKKVSSGTLFANGTGSHSCSDQYRK